MTEVNDILFEYNEFKDFFDVELTEDGCDLKPAVNLRNAAGICIFTDRRSDADDIVPNEMGYPGDDLNAINEKSLGSKLWLRLRGKSLPATLTEAEADVKESLQWLLDDKIASAINVEAEFLGTAKQALRFVGEIVRLDGENLKFNYVWEQPLFR